MLPLDLWVKLFMYPFTLVTMTLSAVIIIELFTLSKLTDQLRDILRRWINGIKWCYVV